MNESVSRDVCFLSSSNRLGEEGQQSVMQQSCGREKKEMIKKKKRGNERKWRREVAKGCAER